jgi:hypothetical protein
MRLSAIVRRRGRAQCLCRGRISWNCCRPFRSGERWPVTLGETRGDVYRSSPTMAAGRSATTPPVGGSLDRPGSDLRQPALILGAARSPSAGHRTPTSATPRSTRSGRRPIPNAVFLTSGGDNTILLEPTMPSEESLTVSATLAPAAPTPERCRRRPRHTLRDRSSRHRVPAGPRCTTTPRTASPGSTQTYVDGSLYIDGNLDVNFGRIAAGFVGTGGTGAGKGAFRAGVRTTAHRPSPAQVGDGA